MFSHAQSECPLRRVRQERLLHVLDSRFQKPLTQGMGNPSRDNHQDERGERHDEPQCHDELLRSDECSHSAATTRKTQDIQGQLQSLCVPNDEMLLMMNKPTSPYTMAPLRLLVRSEIYKPNALNKRTRQIGSITACQ